MKEKHNQCLPRKLLKVSACLDVIQMRRIEASMNTANFLQWNDIARHSWAHDTNAHYQLHIYIQVGPHSQACGVKLIFIERQFGIAIRKFFHCHSSHFARNKRPLPDTMWQLSHCHYDAERVLSLSYSCRKMQFNSDSFRHTPHFVVQQDSDFAWISFMFLFITVFSFSSLLQLLWNQFSFERLTIKRRQHSAASEIDCFRLHTRRGDLNK